MLSRSRRREDATRFARPHFFTNESSSVNRATARLTAVTGSSANLEIRRSLTSERAEALDITLSAYTEYARAMRPEYWDSYRQHIVDTLTDFGAAQQLVAIANGAPVGTTLYCPPGSAFADDAENVAASPDCPEVRLLAVAPAGRGQGVAHAIMEFCIERARNDNAPGLVLHTMTIMEAARSLYDSMGFVRAPELDFQPAKEWFVEGYRLDFDEPD